MWNLLESFEGKSNKLCNKAWNTRKRFKASDGWLQGVLKCSDMIEIKFNGEAMEIDAEQCISISNKWKKNNASTM